MEILGSLGEWKEEDSNKISYPTYPISTKHWIWNFYRNPFKYNKTKLGILRSLGPREWRWRRRRRRTSMLPVLAEPTRMNRSLTIVDLFSIFSLLSTLWEAHSVLWVLSFIHSLLINPLGTQRFAPVRVFICSSLFQNLNGKFFP